MSLGRSVSAASMLGPTKVSISINLTVIEMIIMLLLEQVVRRVDRPRPLKLSAANRLSALELSSVEDVVVLMENVCRFLLPDEFEDKCIVAGISMGGTTRDKLSTDCSSETHNNNINFSTQNNHLFDAVSATLF